VLHCHGNGKLQRHRADITATRQRKPNYATSVIMAESTYHKSEPNVTGKWTHLEMLLMWCGWNITKPRIGDMTDEGNGMEPEGVSCTHVTRTQLRNSIGHQKLKHFYVQKKQKHNTKNQPNT